MFANCEFGHQGEELAVLFLQEKGYQIIERNWHAGKLGELDIVAILNNEIYFVEVKTRRHTGLGWPEEAVTAKKIAHLIKAMESYIGQHPQLPKVWHCGVIAIILSTADKIYDLKYYPDINWS